MSYNRKAKGSDPSSDIHYLSTYKKTYPKKILELARGSEHGLTIEQLADKLDVCHFTLYRWARNHADFDYALKQVTTNRLAKLQKLLDTHVVTEGQFTKVYDRSITELLRMSGWGRNVSCIRGVDNDNEAMQKINEAVARGEMSLEAADIMGKHLERKSNIKRNTDMQDDIDKLKAKLGIE